MKPTNTAKKQPAKPEVKETLVVPAPIVKDTLLVLPSKEETDEGDMLNVIEEQDKVDTLQVAPAKEESRKVLKNVPFSAAAKFADYKRKSVIPTIEVSNQCTDHHDDDDDHDKKNSRKELDYMKKKSMKESELAMRGSYVP